MGQVSRRQFLIVSGALLSSPLVRAQAQRERRVLGILSPGRPPAPEQAARHPFNSKLRALGWIDGQNLTIVRGYAEGAFGRLPDLAADLVKQHADVIYAFGPEAAIAAARATKTVPIVFWGVGSPVERGLVQSLARPGGNVTGTEATAGYVELLTKQLELMKEIAPGIVRVALIANPTASRTVTNEPIQRKNMQPMIESAARNLQLEVTSHSVSQKEDFDAVFAAILGTKAQGLQVAGTPLTWSEARRTVEFANRNRLVSALFAKDWVELGGLFSYGLDIEESIGQTATQIDKIFRGARPAEIPVELPRKFELVVNAKTAGQIGITIPKSILLRADRVIE